MTEFPSLRRLNVSYTLVHVVYWAMFAIFAGYQTSLLLGRGFTSGEAGIFASIRCFAGILAQPLLGGWADRHPEVPIKRLLNACLVLALGVNVVFYTTRPGFWGTALIFLTLGILELNAYPLLDSMAVQFIAAGVDMSYSLSRGLGSLSYALACVACGQQAVRFGTESLLLTHMALLVLMIAVVALYPAFPKDALQAQGGGERPHSILYILKSSRPFTLTLVSLFFTLAAIMPIVSFMVNLVSDRGGDEGHLGLALFLMGASELPAALLFTPLFRRFGAAVEEAPGRIVCRKAPLHGIDIDAAQIPDLVPVLAVTAALADGVTHITGAARLRLKESDRLAAVADGIRRLGGRVEEGPDSLTITGVSRLAGGRAEGYNDHRIVMALSMAALGCEAPVTVTDAQSVAKSWPAFFEDYRAIGGTAHVIDHR